MPAGRPDSGGSGESSGGGTGAQNATGRTSFRPPWVKEGPKPIPMPTAPWTLNKRAKDGPPETQQKPEVPAPRKTSTVKIVPVQPAENGTAARDPHTFERPKLREVPKPAPKETTKLQSNEVKVPITLTRRESNNDLPMKVHIESSKPTIPKVELRRVNRERTIDRDDAIDKAIPAERNAIVRQESMKKLFPVPPQMPPPPPPPPKLPFDKRESLNRSQLEKLESLRARPRKRPDWAAMMKEVEGGAKKLKHVECNDRSQPLLPQNKDKGQFIYESEQANIHNQLLKQIQVGRNLKHVKTNDRSKPILEGLRKFRRQMTIEEQIQKSQSMANMPQEEVEEEADEMDDIDKVRDDLQSTKQMLALELRNKEAQIRENKRLLTRLQTLEAELEKERETKKQNGDTSASVAPAVDDKLVKNIKEEATSAKKRAEELDKKFHETADQLDVAKNDLDEARRQNQILEKKLQQALQGAGIKRQSVCDRRESIKAPPPEEEETEEESETESESGDETNEEKQKRRAERELRFLGNKLKSYKNKEEAARAERKNLRDQMKKNQQTMKEEKKKFRALQKEVNKMASLMKDVDEDEEEEEDAEEEETETEEESETESESESSEEEESSESEPEDSPLEKRKGNRQSRVKRHENCLNALKKGNYMLKANVDRLQDDLNKQKEMVVLLQEDLDSVLAELG